MRTAPLLAVALAAAAPGTARAYRPFDQTDAAVADRGALEVELGPLGLLAAPGRLGLAAPALVLNYGLWPGWEAVLQGRQLWWLEGLASGARFQLVDTELVLKGVLRPGSLQGAPGPSVALEAGVVLPEVGSGEPGAGAIATVIVSQRWEALTVHGNLTVALTRTGAADVQLGAILEGPAAWPVRPVAEAYADALGGAGWSGVGLVGAIWQPTEALAVDLAVRGTTGATGASLELRAGLTFEVGSR